MLKFFYYLYCNHYIASRQFSDHFRPLIATGNQLENGAFNNNKNVKFISFDSRHSEIVAICYQKRLKINSVILRRSVCKLCGFEILKLFVAVKLA